MKRSGRRGVHATKRCLQRAADWLLPRCCLLCGETSGEDNLCPACKRDLPRARHACARCALPMATAADAVCGVCLSRPPSWDAMIAGLNYGFPADSLVCRFKFQRSLAAGLVLGRELLEAVRECEADLPQAVVPVPLHWTRQFRRQFNQAEVLALHVARPLGLPVLPRLLRRSRRTPAQSGLDAKNRRRNLAGAISAKPDAARTWQGAHLALVDDVCTTGATLEACTAVLLKTGAGRVSVWVAARAPP